MIRLFLFATFVFQLAAACASASTVTTCGESDGYAFYFSGGLVQPEESGWRKDGITGGRFLLIRSGDEFDLVFTDATQGTRSAKADGATIIALGGSSPFIIMESYFTPAGPSVTVYSFQIDQFGRGHVVWSQTKVNGLVNKSAIYRAECTNQ